MISSVVAMKKSTSSDVKEDLRGAMKTRAGSRDISLRHTVATLAYRAAKTLRKAPADFSSCRVATGSRSAGEILAHMCDLFDWALSQARGKQRWRNSKPRSWSEDSDRFFAAITALDEYLASDAVLHAHAEKMFQGAVADALTHVGQLAMLRRLAGARVRGENYYLAKIEIGRTGPEQNPAVSEFG
jgi:hypothetical protein